jgi:hypothetical protein
MTEFTTINDYSTMMEFCFDCFKLVLGIPQAKGDKMLIKEEARLVRRFLSDTQGFFSLA